MVYAPALGVFAASVFLIGFCAAGFGLARHSFMTTPRAVELPCARPVAAGRHLPARHVHRPVRRGRLLAIFGDEHAAIWFFGGCLIATVLLVLLGPDPEKQLADDPEERLRSPEDTGEPVTGAIPTAERIGVLRTMWRFRRVLSRLGLAAASLSAVRSARQVVLPLWGFSIGLDAQTIALVVGISGAIDFALFYASGQVMDRFGRLWAALPAMVLMGAGLHRPRLHARPRQRRDVVRDVRRGARRRQWALERHPAHARRRRRPARRPAPFLGSWRTLTDAGGAISPLLVSAITAVSSLSIATASSASCALLGGLAFVRWVPMFVPRVRP
jgi:hypothetical protein